MSIDRKSILTTDDLSDRDLDLLFQRTLRIKDSFKTHGNFDIFVERSHREILGLVFFEPSTRTRFSFQVAASRLNIQNFYMSALSETSLAKGESLIDTLENIAAMQPDVLVLRYGETEELDQTVKNLKCSVINGGCGTAGHPTQAFIDAFTIMNQRGQIQGERVLIVGDVLHSRVANSNLQLLQRLGAEVAVSGPSEILPTQGDWAGVRKFDTLADGISWCTVCMGLRVQLERHPKGGIGLSLADYRDRYGIDTRQLQYLSKEALIMHPGPFVRGIDFSAEVLLDPRCVVREQVANGVYLRAALLSMVLNWGER